MNAPLRLLDRFVLACAGLPLLVALPAAFFAWFAFAPRAASFAGAVAIAVALSIAYGRLARSGEYRALVRAGISPRRIGASVVAVCAIAAAIEAAASCAFRVPAVRTEYAGFVLSAAQLPLAASLALPIAVSAGREEPWARMTLALVGYAVALFAVDIVARMNGWAPGLEWLFIDAGLVVADGAAYRYVSRPKAS